jgi:hypothetical protein
MPRKPKPGHSWVTVLLDDKDIEVLKRLAKKDRRSLSNYLQLHLSDHAAWSDVTMSAAAADERTRAGAPLGPLPLPEGVGSNIRVPPGTKPLAPASEPDPGNVPATHGGSAPPAGDK